MNQNAQRLARNLLSLIIMKATEKQKKGSNITRVRTREKPLE